MTVIAEEFRNNCGYYLLAAGRPSRAEPLANSQDDSAEHSEVDMTGRLDMTGSESLKAGNRRVPACSESPGRIAQGEARTRSGKNHLPSVRTHKLESI
jgi:hypothetical protein